MICQTKQIENNQQTPNTIANIDLSDEIYTLNHKIYEVMTFVIRYQSIFLRSDPDLKRMEEMVSLISKAVTTLIEYEIYDVSDSTVNVSFCCG